MVRGVGIGEKGPGLSVKPSVSRLLLILGLILSIAFAQSAVGQAQHFDVAAKAAFLIDADTGQVLFEKNADEPRPPASLTKIVTLLVAMDAVKAGRVSLDDPVRTSKRASEVGGSQVYLAEGETHSLEKMLKAVAIASGNDASMAVAEFIAGTEAAFTTLMNERARSLGMTNSVFHNADGLPPEPGESASLTSARDIAKAAAALIAEHPKVLDWTSTPMEKFRDNPLFILYNTNRLVGKYQGLDGLKTGHTQEAGWSLVATAKRGDLRLISVVMGADSQTAREEQTRALLDHGFNRFVPVVIAEGSVGSLRDPMANPEQFEAVVAGPVRVLAPRGSNVEVRGTLVRAANLSFPVAKGEQVGEYVVYIDGNEVRRVPAFAAVDVERANFFVRIWRMIRDFFLGLFGRL